MTNEITEEMVDYIGRYGGRCRDCADEDGVCPNSGLPCGAGEKAIRHVLGAYAYGVKHGFEAALPQGEDVAGMVEQLRHAAFTEPEPNRSALHSKASDKLEAQAAQITSLSAKVAEVERARDDFARLLARSSQRTPAAEAERDELRAAIFGGTNYAPDLRNGNFVEMARSTEQGRQGALDRALAAEARASELQREVERLRREIQRAADILHRNLGRQDEKVLDVEPILRAALQQEGE